MCGITVALYWRLVMLAWRQKYNAQGNPDLRTPLLQWRGKPPETEMDKELRKKFAYTYEQNLTPAFLSFTTVIDGCVMGVMVCGYADRSVMLFYDNYVLLTLQKKPEPVIYEKDSFATKAGVEKVTSSDGQTLLWVPTARVHINENFNEITYNKRVKNILRRRDQDPNLDLTASDDEKVGD